MFCRNFLFLVGFLISIQASAQLQAIYFAEKEVKVLLIEPRGVKNTGDASESEMTAENDIWIWIWGGEMCGLTMMNLKIIFEIIQMWKLLKGKGLRV